MAYFIQKTSIVSNNITTCFRFSQADFIVLLSFYFSTSAYDGLTHSPIRLFPNATSEERSIYSRRRNIPPYRELEACASYSLPQNDYEFFHPELMRTWSYASSGKHEVRGVGVLRMVVNQCEYQSSNRQSPMQRLFEKKCVKNIGGHMKAGHSWILWHHFCKFLEKSSKEEYHACYTWFVIIACLEIHL